MAAPLHVGSRALHLLELGACWPGAEPYFTYTGDWKILEEEGLSQQLRAAVTPGALHYTERPTGRVPLRTCSPVSRKRSLNPGGGILPLSTGPQNTGSVFMWLETAEGLAAAQDCLDSSQRVDKEAPGCTRKCPGRGGGRLGFESCFWHHASWGTLLFMQSTNIC